MRQILLTILLTMTIFSCLGQETYDDRLVSTDKELNFAFTDKRGIKADNGVIYYVEKGGQILTAYNADGKVKWTADVLKSCPKPFVGKPEIRYIKLETDKIQIVFGKHDFASADLVDGKVKCLGSD